MNRKERRAKNKKNKVNGATPPDQGLQISTTPEGRTKVSIPTMQGAQNTIANPEQYLADFERAKTLIEEENLADATQLLSSLLKQSPTDTGVMELLGVSSEMLQNYDAALKFFTAARERQPERHHLDVSIANILIKLDRIEEGIALAEKCMKDGASVLNKEDEAKLYGITGNACLLLGDKEKCKTYLSKACELDPENYEHLYNYVSQVGKPKSEDDPYFQRLKELEQRDDSTRSDRDNILLYYSLFDCYDGTKQYETAFDYALTAANHKQKILSEKRLHLSEVVEAIKAYFDQDFFDTHTYEGHDSDVPVFILGMPRSGTTLLEQILQSHPDIEGVGEDAVIGHLIKHYSLMEARGEAFYPLRMSKEIEGYYTPDVIGKKYCDYLEKRHSGAKRVINKAIGNILHAGYMSIALPNAKFIHIKRNAMDSCISTFTKNFADTAQGYSYDLEELGSYYKIYTEILEQWNALLPGKVLNIEYEQIVDNLEDKAREIIDFLELPWDDRCLEFHKTESVVRTASITQVRQPIYKSSVNRWKRYGPKIAPLIKALGDVAPQEAQDYLKSL